MLNRVRYYCEKWDFPFENILEIRENAVGSTMARPSTRHPTLLSVGGNGLDDETTDRFTVKRYNYLKQRWQLMYDWPGYRFGHCVVHVGDYLYIFGGQTGRIWNTNTNNNNNDSDSGSLSTVRRGTMHQIHPF